MLSLPNQQHLHYFQVFSSSITTFVLSSAALATTSTITTPIAIIGNRSSNISITMFSANENLQLRQHKRRIVQGIESCMPEEALDAGTTAMVMQVSCKAPGCVPLETAIIIVFPPSTTSSELIPGLPASASGGSFKTKILKPMADVDEDDILDALPPCFMGGRRSMEVLCRRARDVMLAQITQLFGETSEERDDRRAMALYLQQCLQDYLDHDCVPPELEQSYPEEENKGVVDQTTNEIVTDSSTATQANGVIGTTATTQTSSTTTTTIPAKGNIVLRRPGQDDPFNDSATAGNGSNKITTLSARSVVPPKHQRAIQQASINGNASSSIAKLFEREHAPGIRQAGCPCCHPENPSALLENMMMM